MDIGGSDVVSIPTGAGGGNFFQKGCSVSYNRYFVFYVIVKIIKQKLFHFETKLGVLCADENSN